MQLVKLGKRDIVIFEKNNQYSILRFCYESRYICRIYISAPAK